MVLELAVLVARSASAHSSVIRTMRDLAEYCFIDSTPFIDVSESFESLLSGSLAGAEGAWCFRSLCGRYDPESVRYIMSTILSRPL